MRGAGRRHEEARVVVVRDGSVQAGAGKEPAWIDGQADANAVAKEYSFIAL